MKVAINPDEDNEFRENWILRYKKKKNNQKLANFKEGIEAIRNMMKKVMRNSETTKGIAILVNEEEYRNFFTYCNIYIVLMFPS